MTSARRELAELLADNASCSHVPWGKPKCWECRVTVIAAHPELTLAVLGAHHYGQADFTPAGSEQPVEHDLYAIARQDQA
ncbi:MAG TPA: hypothetical protein VHD87_15200 [Acidimicrobiales bacterium]|nr:hypothetical protein [Acidimicrobiales bacterium]